MLNPETELAALLALWQSRRQGRPLPAWKDFVPEDFVRWMPHLQVIGVEHDPRRYLLRLIGTAVVEYDGADYTNRYLDEVLSPDLMVPIIGHYGRCITERRPVRLTYRGRFRRTPTGVDKMFLPLSSDGEIIDRMLLCIYADFDERTGDRRPPLQELENPAETIEPL